MEEFKPAYNYHNQRSPTDIRIECLQLAARLNESADNAKANVEAAKAFEAYVTDTPA